jgi:hypothetical protein
MKRERIRQARLDDARAQVSETEAKLATVDAAIVKFENERWELQKQLQAYSEELRSIEAEFASPAKEMPMLPVESRMLSWIRRHDAVAGVFCNVMLRINREGAQRFVDNMWSLWQAAEALHPLNGSEDIDPSTTSMTSLYHLTHNVQLVTAQKQPLIAAKSPYGHVSQRWLLSFEAMARQLKDEHATMFEEHGVQASAFKKLVGVLCQGLDKPSLRAVQPARQKPPLFGLSKDSSTVPDELDEYRGAWAVLPLVWLPLALYVRSTTHLYEMLDRLHHMQLLSLESASGPNAEDELRNVLDRDQRRYSYLVFAITAALQTIVLAKHELGRKFPFPLLASSPPDPAKSQVNGYPMSWDDSWFSAMPIFRGIWVGAEVDEERAVCAYSFQSFSRKIEGAAQVLSFYASVEGSPVARLAAKHKHVLILVARQLYASSDCYALPVQLVDGPRAEKSELEVLLPPFVRYEFDDEMSLTSADFDSEGPLRQAQTKLRMLREKWDGFVLPPLLMSMLRRDAASVNDEFPEIREIRPFVSLRFVTRICLAEPMRRLFSGPATRLYDFGSSQ